jgi:DNA-binding MarR family transcriptional regulator
MTLTPNQAKALDACRMGATMAEVAERFGWTKPATCAVLGKLYRAGFVTRRIRDRVRNTYTQTIAGRAAWYESLK